MIKKMLIAGVVLLILFSSTAYSAEGVYGRFSLGLAAPVESDLLDSTLPGIAVKTKYKSGLDVGGVIGYAFEKTRLEMGLAYQKNDFDNAHFQGADVRMNGDVSLLSVLINGYYDFNNRSAFTPYLSAGIGFSRIQVTDLNIPGAGIFSATDEDYMFSYLMGFGVAYEIDENVSIDIGYQNFTPSDPNFDTTQAEFKSHNISLGLRISF
ncbi:outer membrane beta-barrel protein [Deltaproteobacteria bacterium]|nr:outer membrane beta-barrel protein [Deltaproteobacteria bacterium]